MGGSRKWFKTLVTKNSSTKKTPPNNQDDQEKVPAERTKFWQRKNRSRDKNIRGMFNKYGPLKEEKAAIYIQTEFRGYLARKALRKMKGMVRLQALVGGNEVKKQAATTLHTMQSWIRIQAQVRARRSIMVAEARIKQQKREHQLKLEAELHDIEVDWLDGAETMEEILARVRQREEAALKRERAMAYAFSHQWRANSRTNHGYAGYEADKTNWGWSWMERWIAARPWENRLLAQSMKDGLENNVSNGRKNGNKHLKGVSVKKTILPSIKTGQMNVKSSAKDVPSHNGINSISDSKEHPNLSEAEAKKILDLSNSEKPAMQKMNKSQASMSQLVDATVLAS